MVTKNVKDAAKSLRRCNSCLNVLQLQINELLNDIDDHLITPTNILKEQDHNEYGCLCDLDDEDDFCDICSPRINDNDDYYCDECGELYPDDCVCEEDDYMDDDLDNYTIVSRSRFINNGRWVFDEAFGDETDSEVVTPPLNAFARARWLNENH